jgi:hypothetical protein
LLSAAGHQSHGIIPYSLDAGAQRSEWMVTGNGPVSGKGDHHGEEAET